MDEQMKPQSSAYNSRPFRGIFFLCITLAYYLQATSIYQAGELGQG